MSLDTTGSVSIRTDDAIDQTGRDAEIRRRSVFHSRYLLMWEYQLTAQEYDRIILSKETV